MQLLAANPRLIMLRLSGYGQTGPYRNRPGFGVVAEAMGGLRHLTAEPGRVPVRVGVSIGDTLAALHGVIGILLALQHRHASGRGQVIDVALYEAVFNCMESLLPEYSAFGAVRGPAGSALPGIAPTNAYRCSDGGYALIAGNGDSIFRRLMTLIGRDDLAHDPALADNAGRVARVAELDAGDRRLDGAAHGRRGAGGARRRVGTGRPHLHGGRHRGRPALPRPRHARRGEPGWMTAARSPCRASCPSCRPRRAVTVATRRRSARTPDDVLREIGLSDVQIVALRDRGIVN